MAIPKFITAEEAAALVKDGDTVGTSGFVVMGHAEELTAALEKRFLETGSPKDLTVTWGASQSNTRDRVGNDRFSHPGFVKRAVQLNTRRVKIYYLQSRKKQDPNHASLLK